MRVAINKYRDLDPVVLYKEDLLALESLFQNVVNCTRNNLIMHARVADHDVSAEPFHSFDSLTNADFPSHVDKFDISAREIGPEQTIVKSLLVEVDRSSGDVRLSHETDAEWVKSAGDQLIAFFKARKPWYAGLKRFLAPLFNATMVLSLLLATPALLSGRFWMLVFPVMLVAYALTMLILSLNQILFPYSRIGLYPASHDQRRNYELWAVLAWGVVIAIAVSGTLLFM